MDVEQNLISVIIPTRNGGPRFGELLAALRGQSRVPEEILVIDSGSGDETLDLARQHGARVISIAPRDFDHGGTRTLGARAAIGDLLVYMTQDAVPADQESLAHLLAPLADERVAAAYGRQLPYPEASCFARHLRAFNYPERSVVRSFEDRARYGFKTAFISNSFAAYRRDRLAEVGFFQEGLVFGEDTFTVAKLLRRGYCVAYAAEARVLHSHNYTLAMDFRRYFDIGVAHVRSRELLESFGSPTGEGRRYVAAELAFLLREKQYVRLPESLVRSAVKLLSYHLGKRYIMLPPGLARWCSLNRGWWSGAHVKGKE
ncbi:MAG: glycosyltransferase family 2 protein [Desulfobulbaceae bacterium]